MILRNEMDLHFELVLLNSVDWELKNALLAEQSYDLCFLRELLAGMLVISLSLLNLCLRTILLLKYFIEFQKEQIID